ncbi:hypothetical protein [Bdellovibrio svalbardensis]|uniref:DoxX family membrane protein n=1 Tax=Bdellovibrio svalbardensis TaxID=2972972 RepID=A0ABT6DFA1_9BACT|nr:hypothetical protein [Bdellovibrio svalbardensis]MDG0815184.1 hypothetical protein [Bdellovibrio svalbardensis]
MLDYIEIICRWAFGLQMAFWGLNGFFHWVAIPPSGDGVTRFTEACIETRFIMPTVKMIEVVCGLLLLCKFAVLLNLLIFAPIVFVITMLHFFHNPKPWPVVLPITVPFLVAFSSHLQPLISTSL